MRPEIALMIKLDATYSAASLLWQSRTPQTLMTLAVLCRAPQVCHWPHYRPATLLLHEVLHLSMRCERVVFHYLPTVVSD